MTTISEFTRRYAKGNLLELAYILNNLSLPKIRQKIDLDEVGLEVLESSPSKKSFTKPVDKSKDLLGE